MVIELTVRPLLESGVVMVLTEPVSSRLVLAIGLVQGVVRGGIAGVCMRPHLLPAPLAAAEGLQFLWWIPNTSRGNV